MTYDGIRYIKELWTDSSTKQYDVINIDAFKLHHIVPFFESKVFFQMIRDVWRQWDEVQCRPRMLVMNAYYPGEHNLVKTTAYRNAVKVFGEDHVEARSDVILSVLSEPEGQCAVEKE